MRAYGAPETAPRTRDGVALAAVLLITVALTVMAHAALVLSRTEALVARSEVRRLTGSYQAAAALAAMESGLDSLPGTGSWSAPWGSVQTLRLGAEMALLRSSLPGVASGEGRARLLWAPDAGTRMMRRTAAVVGGAGLVRDPGAELSPADPGAPCGDGTTPPPGLLAWARAQAGDPHPSLGPVPLDGLLSRLPAFPPGPLALDSALARGVAGSAAAAGSGTGVLAVAGDLLLVAGAELEGWLWVGGDLVIQDGARFRGMADVGGSLRLDAGATLVADPCAASRALGAAKPLRRPWGIGPLAWPAQ